MAGVDTESWLPIYACRTVGHAFVSHVAGSFPCFVSCPRLPNKCHLPRGGRRLQLRTEQRDKFGELPRALARSLAVPTESLAVDMCLETLLLFRRLDQLCAAGGPRQPRQRGTQQQQTAAAQLAVALLHAALKNDEAAGDAARNVLRHLTGVVARGSAQVGQTISL